METKEVTIPYDATAILDNLGVEYTESGEETITIKYECKG